MKQEIHTSACLVCEKLKKATYNNCPFKNLRSRKNMLFEEGDIIYSEGETAEGIFSIYIGKIKLFKKGENNSDEILCHAGPGTIIGYSAVKYSATAITVERTWTCYIINSEIPKVFLNYSKTENQIFLLDDF